ncbi:caspase family protein [Luteolibacter luteus]|uniref:Caspase family protein n=1 Tax=Luteolibacter luteus TaxID=2728835 RepID=A0A858RKB0_9BACT|nr:caspase family protein [Luteolibacter luteus]QJE97736.1 hypothetical protein HHL09_18760 [Luteolibacter luteus]
MHTPGNAVAALFLLPLLLTSLPATGEPIPPAGTAKAWIISPSTYRRNARPDAPADERLNQLFFDTGKSVALHLEGVVGAGNVEHWHGAKASADNVRNLLANVIPQLPQNSLVIVYFCGHGFRGKGMAATRLTSLALDGCDPCGEDPKSYNLSIPTSDLANAFYNNSTASFMIFLDCCHSGQDVPQLRMNDDRDVGTRGFILASSVGGDLSKGCHFTQALLEIWQGLGKTDAPLAELARSEVRDLADLQRSITGKLLLKRKQGVGYPGQKAEIVLGNPDLPLGMLRRTDCVVLLDVGRPNPAGYVVQLDGEVIAQLPEGRQLFLFTVPRGVHEICVGNIELWKNQYDFTGLPYKIIQVDPSATTPVKLSSITPKDLQEKAMESLAAVRTQAAAHGLPTGAIALDATRLLVNTNPTLDRTALANAILEDFPEGNETRQALALVARNQAIPADVQGRLFSSTLAANNLAMDSQLASFYLNCVKDISANRELAVVNYGFDSESDATDHLDAYFRWGAKYWTLSTTPGDIGATPAELLGQVKAGPTVWSARDYKHAAGIVATSSKIATEVPDSVVDNSGNIDRARFFRAMSVRKAVNNSKYFMDTGTDPAPSAAQIESAIRQWQHQLEKEHRNAVPPAGD